MSRRLLGPVGGPIVFFLVAALVFAGLGWVTYAAIGVEQAQREAAARAELGNNLRVALWRLDGRMLPALGVEDSRPFYHYVPGDPDTFYGPLLSANLPDWMKLHFQLDAGEGWTSPQVIPAEVAERMRQAWPEITLRNLNGDRAAVCDTLKERFPARTTWDLFASRDSAIPVDSLPFAAAPFTNDLGTVPPQPELTPNPPLPDPTPKPPPPAVASAPAGDTIYVLGFELCWYDLQPGVQATNQQAGNTIHQQDVDSNQKKSAPPPHPAAVQQQQMYPPGQGNFSARGGNGRGQKDTSNDRAWNDYLNRAETIYRAVQEAKQAGGEPLNMNYGQFPPGLRNSTLPNAPVIPNAPAPPTVPGVGPGNSTPPGTVPPPGGGTGGFGNGDKAKADKDLAHLKQTETEARLLGGLFGEAGKLQLAAQEKQETRAILDEVIKKLEKAGDAKTAELLRQLDDVQQRRFTQEWEQNKERATLRDPATPTTAPVPPVAPGEDHPPGPTPIAPFVTGPVAVHLGSMRPQWVTAPDGSDMLVLVRAVKFQNKTVYQGVVLDWAKLEAALKDEVKDLFPAATLVAVKDPQNVSPDRAMTALPVQLEPGPEPTLPPAGWTPLRIGLVLAWVAALIAVVAVGFSGWSLIDLAERRIRFVSAVTHELRTPLTSLRLYLDMLLSGMIQDEAKRQEYLNTLAMESDRLHRLIDNVLDFAKLEKRRKNGDIKPVNVGELLGTLRATWTDRVAQDGKELVVISTLPAEHEVSTDPAMLQQIVGNLIDNARKYTRDAADKRIWLWAKPGPGSTVLVEVEDRGPGVPANERKTIFKPFRRGEHADSTAGGAGLGLALAKSWSEVLGATLTYRPADDGVGACFRLELPGK